MKGEVDERKWDAGGAAAQVPSVSQGVQAPDKRKTLAVDGAGHASHPVAITFSEFGDVTSATNGQSLPVLYALNEEHPQGWLTPGQLNATGLLVPTEDSAIKWNMWRRAPRASRDRAFRRRRRGKRRGTSSTQRHCSPNVAQERGG